MKTRTREIDIMKGLLAMAMILCHCIQFFGNEGEGIQKFLADMINLTTFSGFLFCFGYVCDLAYYQKTFKHASLKMGRNVVRMLIAFYISGIAYIALAERKAYMPERVRDVLLLWHYPGWSEFLASFAAVLLVGILLYPLMKKMNGKMFAVILVISLVSCEVMPYWLIHDPYLALLVGSNDYITFPVLEYGVFFAAGVWFSRSRISWNKKTLIGALITGIPFVVYYVIDGWLPGRFPPDILFICGGILGVHLYRMISLGLDELAGKSGAAEKVIGVIANVGKSSLFYLLMSNLLIFALEGSKFVYPASYMAFVYYVIIMYLIYYFRKTVSSK